MALRYGEAPGPNGVFAPLTASTQPRKVSPNVIRGNPMKLIEPTRFESRTPAPLRTWVARRVCSAGVVGGGRKLSGLNYDSPNEISELQESTVRHPKGPPV